MFIQNENTDFNSFYVKMFFTIPMNEREHVHRGSLSQNNNNNKTKERVLTNIFYYNSE